MNCQDILTAWLKDNGYDGLCNPYAECGCPLDDLIVCGGSPASCLPGYAGPDPSGESEYLFCASREAAKAAKEDGGA
ncbi:MAG TPA: hypothetical protein VM238_18645 [Phycisphaerae bacterium]|nr:hypothetical protein [Phycisphaerae bacterium]